MSAMALAIWGVTSDYDGLTIIVQPFAQTAPTNLMNSKNDCDFIQRGAEQTHNCWSLYYPRAYLRHLDSTEK
jgi:hypothetical protein